MVETLTQTSKGAAPVNGYVVHQNVQASRNWKEEKRELIKDNVARNMIQFLR